jgi:tetratricopeptide (TPR) repeat protein
MLEVARRAGAGALVVGSVFKDGQILRIDAQIQDVATGKLLGAYSVRGANVFPLADDLTGRIRESLNVAAGARGTPVADLTSNNAEAFRLYTEGVEALANLRYGDAEDRLKQAVQLDPGFASAYFRLASVARQTGDLATAEKYERLIRANVDRLPERQQLLQQAQDATLKDDRVKAIGILESLVARYPDEEDAYIRLNNFYQNGGEMAKAGAALEAGIKAVPNSGPLHNTYGYFWLAQGRYPEAIREFEAYVNLRPTEPNPLDSLAEAYVVAGQPEKALDWYSRALRLNFVASYHGRAWALAMLGRYDEGLEDERKSAEAERRSGRPYSLDQYFLTAYLLSRGGRYRDAFAEIDQGIRASQAMKNALDPMSFHVLEMFLHLQLRDAAAMFKDLDQVKRFLPDVVNPDIRRGVGTMFLPVFEGHAHVVAGQLDAARERLQEAQKAYNPKQPGENWLIRSLEGEIALAAGDLAGAEAAFKAGEPPIKMPFNRTTLPPTVIGNDSPSRDGLARVKKARGDLRGAIETYRSLLVPDISSKFTSTLEPRYVLELARLLEQNGDAAGARAEYLRFLELWKHADPNLPELAEARRKVGT